MMVKEMSTVVKLRPKIFFVLFCIQTIPPFDIIFFITDKIMWYLQTKLNFVDKIMSKPELLAPHPLNTTVNAGETASLQCKINSEMQPHIQVTR